MKIKFITCLLIVLTAISCGKDDDTTATYLGTWIATNIDITRCDDFEDEDSRTLRCTDTSCYKLIFNSDGTYSFQTGITTEIGTWTADGFNITFCIEEDEGEICTVATGVITSTLRLTYEATANGCVTAYVLENEVADDDMSN